MSDETLSAKTELTQRLRLVLGSFPEFEVRQVGHNKLRVSRPYDRNRQRTPYCFTLILEEKRKFAQTVEYWWPDGEGAPWPKDRDREQPVRDMIAAELADMGWKRGRSAIRQIHAAAVLAVSGTLFLVVYMAIMYLLD
ncbi:hypothetical protein [Nocardia sp. MW-W600-9]